MAELKLHLGCGGKYLEGYVNIDFPPSEHTIIIPKADIFKDIRKLEYQENSVDEIRNPHLFENFSRQDALKLVLNKLGFIVSEIQQNRSYYRKDNRNIVKVDGKIAHGLINNLSGDNLI